MYARPRCCQSLKNVEIWTLADLLTFSLDVWRLSWFINAVGDCIDLIRAVFVEALWLKRGSKPSGGLCNNLTHFCVGAGLASVLFSKFDSVDPLSSPLLDLYTAIKPITINSLRHLNCWVISGYAKSWRAHSTESWVLEKLFVTFKSCRVVVCAHDGFSIELLVALKSGRSAQFLDGRVGHAVIYWCSGD